MNYNTLKQNGVRFAVIRSSYGTTSNGTSLPNGLDSRLFVHTAGMTAINVPWAIYHYVVGSASTVGQIDRILFALSELKKRGTPPISAKFSDGMPFPTVFLDIEETNITNTQIKAIVEGLQSNGLSVGIYTRKNVWDTITSSITNPWWGNLVLWIAAYGANNGTVPNFVPDLPRGWEKAHLWQYTSLGGKEVGYTSDNLDLNIASGHLYEATFPQPPVEPRIDMLSYIRGPHGLQYEMKRSDGGQERYHVQWDAANPQVWYIVKGENQGFYEKWSFDDNYIYLEMDTSPSPASDGTQRYYTVKKSGARSPKYRRFMSVGEVFNDGGHFVQFYSKADCQPHPENSGNTANTTTFIQGPYRDTFYNGITSDGVIKVLENTEYQYWVRGIGRVRWESAWGDAQISEIHGIGQRPDVKREFIPCL